MVFVSHKGLGFSFRNKMPQATFINMAGDLRHHRTSSLASDGDTGVRDVFQAANGFLKPSRAWRLGTLLYSERKLVIFFLMHFFVTLIVWAHFAFIKNREQEAAVPDGALNFYWKRIAPPLEFGSMHAILFQMALLPLTMSRLTIANLSTTAFDKFIPFNRMLRIHIHLGYTMVSDNESYNSKHFNITAATKKAVGFHCGSSHVFFLRIFWKTMWGWGAEIL